MFLRADLLEFAAKLDPVFAKMLQEPPGGRWDEIGVTTYVFQGWNCRGPAKCKGVITDNGTKEIALLRCRSP